MSNTDVQRIENNIKEARAIVELSNSLDRLKGNRDFKKLILEGYFRDEAVRLVHLKVDPSMQTAERQASVVSQIDAIGGLSSFLRTVEFNASIAAKAIESGEADIEEIQAEELSNV